MVSCIGLTALGVLLMRPSLSRPRLSEEPSATIVASLDVVADLHQVAVTGKRPHVEAYAVNRAVNSVKNDTDEPAPRWRGKVDIAQTCQYVR